MSDRDLKPQSTPQSSWTVSWKRCIPWRLRLVLQDFAALDFGGRVQYLRLKFRRFVDAGLSEFPRRLPIRRIVFVCHGNIIRSPMAEALLRRELNNRNCALEVVSAGTDATPGRRADSRALAIAPEFGIYLSDHRAQLFSNELARGDALIIVMDYLNAAKLAQRFPSVRSRLMLLPRTFGEVGPGELPDPYTGSAADVRACYHVLEDRIRHLADRLVSVHAKSQDEAGSVIRDADSHRS